MKAWVQTSITIARCSEMGWKTSFYKFAIVDALWRFSANEKEKGESSNVVSEILKDKLMLNHFRTNVKGHQT